MHILPGWHIVITLQWRHNERDGASKRQCLDCFFKRLFRRRSNKHQSSVPLAFVMGIHRWPVNSPHKGPVTRKMFPFGDVIMTGSWKLFYPSWNCWLVHMELGSVYCVILVALYTTSNKYLLFFSSLKKCIQLVVRCLFQLNSILTRETVTKSQSLRVFSG